MPFAMSGMHMSLCLGLFRQVLSLSVHFDYFSRHVEWLLANILLNVPIFAKNVDSRHLANSRVFNLIPNSY